MDKAYTPGDIERRIYQRWESSGAFAPSSIDSGGDGEPYCIMLPPPNVTGTLHMGHAFQHTLMDALTRWHRMRGFAALWQPGTDHAGIATQMVVERQLVAEGKHRLDLGREKFVERVWKWKEQSGGTITQQMRRLGESVDWSRDTFTMDPRLSRAVTEVFVRLHEEKLIYRGKRLVNWDPVLLTAVSDLEVVSEEENGSLWHIRYPLADGSGHVVIATTRPETMLGDSAVAVNPNDERYQKLIGAKIRLPITGRLVPIIADDYVDKDFGSGCLKVTPAHDFNDYEIGQRHKLDIFMIFTPDAKIVSTPLACPSALEEFMPVEEKDPAEDIARIGIPDEYQGKDRFVARDAIVRDLERLELIEKIEPHRLKVPRGDRSGAIIEPYLTDQWYVNVAPLAKPALEAVESGRTRFVPENWSKTYYEWMRNIKDWCVSRQLWWGHRIPAWYPRGRDRKRPFVGRNIAEAYEKYLRYLTTDPVRNASAAEIALARDAYAATMRLAEEARDDTMLVDEAFYGYSLQRDADVLDTWFSSALWPFSTLGWPDTTLELKKFYPTNVLITGFDIIFFWVARMMMMGLKFMGDVPFRDVYITGLILDEHGDKMSKAKGNIIDPLDIIDGISLDALLAKRTTGLMQPQMKQRIEANTRKQFPQGMEAHGTDALRFTMASLAGPSREINFSMSRVAGYRNFCNKLWNAARFVLMTVEGQGDLTGEAELSVADRWIVSRFSAVLTQLDQNLRDYRFDLATSAIYEFTWYEFCDWYLELTKPVLQGEASTEAQKRGTRRTLLTTLEALLRALHPLIPFITEEIWQRVHPLAGPLNAAAQFRGMAQPPDMAMLSPFPQTNDFAADTEAEVEVARLKQLILGMRQARSGMNLAPSLRLAVQYHSPVQSEIDLTEKSATYALRLAGLSSLTLTPPEQISSASTSIIVGSTTFSIPMKGLIEPKAEAARVSKLIAGNESDIGKLTAKLANTRYTESAKPEMVAADRSRLAELTEQTAGYKRHLEKVHKLEVSD